MKHTPGPWRRRPGPYGGLWAGPALLPHPGHETVALYRPEALAEREADAALIAAAPDMLAALRLIAGFPHNPRNRGLTLSEAAAEMARIAAEAVSAATPINPNS